jgi:hypothetical protein
MKRLVKLLQVVRRGFGGLGGFGAGLLGRLWAGGGPIGVKRRISATTLEQSERSSMAEKDRRHESTYSDA